MEAADNGQLAPIKDCPGGFGCLQFLWDYRHTFNQRNSRGSRVVVCLSHTHLAHLSSTTYSLGLCLDVRGYCSRRFHVQSCRL